MVNEKIKVLIIDGLEPIQKKFLRIINSCPEMIVSGTAMDGYEAIAMAINNRPDIILMDIEMESQLAGLKACNEILKQCPDIKIIILTVHNEDSIIFKAFQAGIVDYLMKNSPDETVIEAIRNAYSGQSSINSRVAEPIRREFKRIKDSEGSILRILDIIVSLTPTEIDIIKLLCSGATQRDITRMRCIELSTVKTHISHILRKFNKKTTAQVVDVVTTTGLLSFIR